MDIQSLLSSNGSPSDQATPPPASPRKPVRAKATVPSSPLVQVTTPGEHPRRAASPSAEPLTGPAGGKRTPPSAELGPKRPESGNPLNNLADLASIQQHQPQRATTGTPGMIRNPETYEPQGSTPSTMNPNVDPVSHTTATRPPFDVSMSEPPRETVRSDYSNTCLSIEAQRTATQLAADIQQNRHAYESRVQFIRLLHQGFVDHIYPPSSPESRGDPHKYDVLKDLRAAREELDSLFAIGEDLWAEWIQDESLLARTIEERIAVIELCQRSVEEEYGSTKLWIIYGDWLLYLYNAAQARDAPAQGQWSEEDKQVGRETFKWESVMEVWKNAAETTKWHLNDSHQVWNRYLELALREVANSPSAENVSQLRGLFDHRLRTPHMGWDHTFQLFSTFVSTYYNANYEQIMVEMNSKCADAKATCDAREINELALQRAAEAGDTSAEYNAFVEYIDCEVNRKGRAFNYDLSAALYQRAVLRFPTDANLWEDYMILAIDESIHGRIATSVIPRLERATRHCPWSGSLWSHHLLTAERAGYSLEEISEIKHKATRTGLLDAAGISEVLKVHTTWCSYLRRHAFQADATDEDLDVAEVGIRSAIESVQELGEKDNKTVPNDPMFRLERIYIRYLSESGSWDSARETFKGLIRRHGHSYEFWLMYYTWELLCWAKFTQSDGSAGASRRTPNPSYATAVLKQALHRTDLDWPEKIMDRYISHCEHYEDAEELQVAVVEIRKTMKDVARRREKEALQNTSNQPATTYGAPTSETINTEQLPQASGVDGDTHIGKRKREDDFDLNGLASKKPRPDVMETTELAEPADAPKRDREHATVMVKNLPQGITTLRIRQFFRDCGTINSLKILPGEVDSMSAVIEFESKEDADTAKTRDQKTLDGNSISVQSESQATVFVTNFPPAADEAYIRDTFSLYGDIVEVRFPSLKYNTHRRFCYVQFRSSSSAYSATELNKKDVGENLNLVVKISDPTKREGRSGPAEEGREIHISNLDWKATEDDLVELFTAYGNVEAARIPTKANGGSKGFGFVVFSTEEAATAALAMDSQTFRNRPLRVHISSRTGPKRLATAVVSRVSRSHSPGAGEVDTNGAEGSTRSPSINRDNGDNYTKGERKHRTLGLMNIPDTVNDARIRALVEPFGPLVKIILRPDHQGAIVEFRDVNDAGRAAMGLDGKEISPGSDRKIGVGRVEEMLKCGPEKKVERIQVGKQREQHEKEKGKSAGTMMQPPLPIRRPVQPGSAGRGGRRAGLGVKRATNMVGKQQTGSKATGENDTQKSTSTPRNNNDFRALLEKSRAKTDEEKITTTTTTDGEKKDEE